MRLEEDAYGQELWAYFNGDCGVFEVIERDDGYVDAMSPEVYFFEYDEWSLVEQKAMACVRGRVLDVGCGAGRHSLYLQKKGFDVLGIDVSPLAIKLCKQRGLKKTEVMSLEEAKFTPNSFGTIIMMGNNFGLFGSFKKAQRLLNRFYRMTSRNALIVADTRDPYKTSNPWHLAYHKQNRQRGRMSGQARIRVRFRKCATKWFDYLLVSKEEMNQILERTGWKVKEFIDSDDAEYLAIIEKI
jgi:SAM-dependent methyltransferase